MSDFVLITPSHGRGLSMSESKPSISIGFVKSATSAGKKRHSFSINGKLMGMMRWVGGDRIQVAIDFGGKLVKITRHPDGPYTLSARSKKELGKSVTVDSGFSAAALQYLTKRRIGNFVIDDSSIIVEWKD